MINGGADAAPVAVVVLAHNEERRIARCLATLPLSDAGFAIHVVVNGSRDSTAAIVASIAAQHDNLTLHDWPEPGKARSWNRIVLDTLPSGSPAVVLVDGDAEVAAGAIPALLAAFDSHPEANLASAPPLNGRRADHYRRLMLQSHGVFGDLYALRGSFVDRLRASGIRLPVDLVGDDGLVGALAKTDLGALSQWRDERVCPVMAAGFRCEPFAPLNPRSWRMQHGRMINYAVRHFQDRIITHVLRDQGPEGLPERLASLYPQHLSGFKPRGGLWSWFDRRALARMQAKAL
ncbi:MAG: family 2 glycosyl transferase [Novosphingobium sp. 28-62-57]|uniref:glycosyltransferase family 2 protein n=1 Tax=unclassified Novosphingobium TaxID=2644732 RepID=UPI000BCCF108|nr:MULTISPECIES: glycosyltransferase [unclassified Novosphingobium]OYW48528.1 MAG: family 2 glycosyl transferase [Novosphingobium sp. 12-62-10]OYZ08464.1 MAG: family 2 glycosyl transferase [Novosphingobium sp. 28-62-57]OZA30975.1 MAG: family 2 glycosyl transferase [Novosphingobium sp. 17-62-9]HQS71164.1 glycosyltransferase [Novosphingobium sp.]